MYAPIVRLEEILIFFAYEAHKNIKVHRINIKWAFLNEELKEEVYLQQLPSFENLALPNHFYKLMKSVYGLKQALHAWYETLNKFMDDSGFIRGLVDPTLFRRLNQKHLMLVQIYVDDIIFRIYDCWLLKTHGM